MKQKEQVTKKEKRIEMNEKDEMIIDSDSWESYNKLFYEKESIWAAAWQPEQRT